MRQYPDAPPEPESLAEGDAQRPIGDWFAASAGRHPSRVAVVADGAAVTYRELDGMVGRIARALRAARGPRAGNVSLLLGPDPWLVAALLGVLRAGAALVPLDPSYPAARTRFMAENAEATMLLSDRRHAEAAVAIAPPGASLLLEDLGDDARSDLDGPGGELTSDALAVILYTSGSSGQPKGVMHSHASLLHNVRSYAAALALTSEDRVAMLFGVSAFGGVRDILAASLSGAALLPYDIRERGVGRLGDWLTSQEVSVVNIGVTAFRHLVAVLEPCGQVPGVRALRVGGETVTRADVAAAARHFPAARLHLAFGTTETGNPTEMVLARGASLPTAGSPVGFPRPGFEVSIVDSEGAPLPAGTRGEIAVRSRFLSPGYWRLPGLTARAFVADDSAHPDLRTYRTGDLGLLASDGCLVHLGRADNQVKIAGYRLSPSEVEACLLQLPGVRHAVVATREARDGDRQLVAWVAPGDAPGMGPSEMRRALAARVPAHLVPAAIVVLPALPATPQGKIDRRALPEPDWSRRRATAPLVGPRTPVERALAEVWAEVLGLDTIGVQDTFLDLGGDSLRAGRLAARVNERFGVDLALPTLLAAATVEDMAVLVVAALVQREAAIRRPSPE